MSFRSLSPGLIALPRTKKKLSEHRLNGCLSERHTYDKREILNSLQN